MAISLTIGTFDGDRRMDDVYSRSLSVRTLGGTLERIHFESSGRLLLDVVVVDVAVADASVLDNITILGC